MSDASSAIRSRIRRLMRAQRFAVLSTCGAGSHPYASLVAFAVSKDLRRIYFCTSRATRKYRNLAEQPNVALLIDSRHNASSDLQTAQALTALAVVRELSAAGRRRAGGPFVRRHPSLRPFVEEPGSAMLCAEVEEYLLVERFQEIARLRIGQSAAARSGARPAWRPPERQRRRGPR